MKIVISGNPIPQQRVRLFKRHGKSGAYDPDSKKKNLIKIQIKQYLKRYMPFKPLEHPRVSFIFHMPIPASTPKRSRPVFDSGMLKHELRPDVDNLVKLYLDCMNGIVWPDDKTVSLGFAVKLYHPEPKTIIVINETSAFLSPMQIDQLVYCGLFAPESGTQKYEEISSLDDWYTPTHLGDEQFCKSYGLSPPFRS